MQTGTASPAPPTPQPPRDLVVGEPGSPVGASADPVSAGCAGQMYEFLYGQPLAWRDLAFTGGVDSSGVSWSDVSWTNISWDAVTWQNVSWEAFNWTAVSWQDISWEGVTWEDISWETLVPKSTGKGKDNGRKGAREWRVLD